MNLDVRVLKMQRNQLAIKNGLPPISARMVNKYGIDWFNEHVVMPAARLVGGGLWRFGDQIAIDDGLVNGSARTVGWLGSVMRYAQTGYLYHYAFAMILGLASFLLWILWRT